MDEIITLGSSVLKCPMQFSVYVLVTTGTSWRPDKNASKKGYRKENVTTVMNFLTIIIYCCVPEKDSGFFCMCYLPHLFLHAYCVYLALTLPFDPVVRYFSFSYQIWHMATVHTLSNWLFDSFWHKFDLSGSRLQCDKNNKMLCLIWIILRPQSGISSYNCKFDDMSKSWLVDWGPGMFSIN